MNPTSSRSHALFIIIIEQNEISMEGAAGGAAAAKRSASQAQPRGPAGSERVRAPWRPADKKINKSLSALGRLRSDREDGPHPVPRFEADADPRG